MPIHMKAEKHTESEDVLFEDPLHGLDGVRDLVETIGEVVYGSPSSTDHVHTYSDGEFCEVAEFSNWARLRDWLATAEQDPDTAISRLKDRVYDEALEDDVPGFLAMILENYKSWDDYVVDNKLTLRFVD